MNEITNQHNDLINLPLRKFNSSEIDILLSICYECQNKGIKEIVIPFSEIRKRSYYKSKDDERFYKDIESMGDKLFSLHMKIGDDREYTKFVLFPTYTVSEEEQTLTVAVNEKFTYLLNNLENNYTSLELQQSASLRSTYAKGIYKKLRKERDLGKWIVTAEDFRTYLDIPKSYKTNDITRKVINPSVNELKPFFHGLKCDSYYDKHKKGRGRPAIAGYIFSFKAQPHEKREKQPSVKQIANKTGWEPTGKFCPQCHKPIYQRLQENENGQYYQLGHPDFKTGGCNYLTNDFSNLLTQQQLDDKRSDESARTDEEIENVNRLSLMFKGLFGR